MSKDYYKILGVEKNASADDLKKAFRALAHKHHPDKTGGDAEKFKEINEAYQVLGDADKRAKYDQFGSAAFDGSGGGNPFGHGFSAGSGPASGWDFSGGAGFEDLGEMFGGMFGSRGRTSRGNDIQVDTDLSFRDAVFGVEREVTLTKPSTCARCGGAGAEPGSKMKTCAACSGKGVKITSQRTILGTFQTKTNCSACDGEGEVPEKPCTECQGSGIARRRTALTVNIPPGTDDGVVYRVRGEGEAMRGGQHGDLLVRVHVNADPRFTREGHIIRSRARIGFTQAALGGAIDVETLDGDITLTIPSGTQSGAEFRLRGKGVPMRNGRGDQIVTIHVVTPTKLSKEQKELMKKINLNET